MKRRLHQKAKSLGRGQGGQSQVAGSKRSRGLIPPKKGGLKSGGGLTEKTVENPFYFLLFTFVVICAFWAAKRWFF
jgi:hypothetical protein